ncbi:MAG: family 78 glycoside hydrolase catalytic domain [Clostridia bacterium]|nr:family 78 glycoside hydrolase catalytic domain [Clostridia bacterium]
MRAINLKCEYLKNPLGIDIENPRVFWNCEGGVTQTAYRIVTDKWDSGKVLSGSMRAVYPLPAEDRERVTCRIKLWDENGSEGEFSEPAFFEYGIRSWQAKWIAGDYKVDRKKRYPVDCFKKEFKLDKEVEKARLYITACGLYEARINGEKAGDFCLAPGHTDYNKRVQYQTYDVTGLLDKDNAVTVQLADGWYRGSIGAWGIRNQYGTQTKLLAQLEIVFKDGSTRVIATDETWKWSGDGPVRFADNKDGETVDARMEPTYSGRARAVSHPVIPTASNNVPVTEHERFKPVVTKAPNGRTLLDFGQNMAGYIGFTLTARAGEKITVRLGEMLDSDGNLTLKNIQCSTKTKTTPLQKIEYTCREGFNEYKTAFSVFGFRYAEVETDAAFTADGFTAYAVYSDMEQTGFFESSNELLNRFVSATAWSTKSNSLDVPTDCPTRERHGWTGDAQIFFDTAAYLFDYAAFSKKYLNDVYDWQKSSGRLPQIAPAGGVDFYMWTLNGSVGWSDVGVLMPYRFYKIYGDKEILRHYYERMKLYAGFMIRRIGKTGFMAKRYGIKDKKYLVNSGQSYGEWAEPAEVHTNDWKDMVAPHPEVSTAYTAYVLGVMSEIAGVLGPRADEEKYKEISENVKKAYRELVETDAFSLDTDRQAQLVRPLAFGLLDESQTAFAEKRLVKAIENYGHRLGTGFLSTPLILGVLEKYDLETAYKLLENEEMPGWLFMPKMGATTVWESWEGTQAQDGIASLNHYSKGAVCEWLFRTMCGINVSGENRFVIRPLPGGSFTYAKAEYKSVFGTVISGWEKTGNGYRYDIVIPPGCVADVVIDGKKQTVTAGSYTF